MKTLRTLAAMALTLTTTLAHAEGGRNGPDLSGTSIPVAFDRGVRLKQIQNAVSTCFATGDEARGVTSLMQKVVRMMWSPSKVKFSSGSLEEGRSDFVKNGRSFLPTAMGDLYFQRDGELTNSADYTFGLRHVDAKGSEYELETGVYLEIGSAIKSDGTQGSQWDVLLHSITQLPFVAWEKVVVEPSYDEFQNIDLANVVVQGVKIILPDNYTQGGHILEFKNARTDRIVTGLKVDVRDYVKCLQGEIQRGNGAK